MPLPWKFPDDRPAFHAAFPLTAALADDPALADLPDARPIMSSPSPSVLVTGASSGIGAATARLFLEKGWQVHAAARRLERMDELAAKGARVHHLDLASPSSIEALAQALPNEAGGPSLLINNAAIGVYGSVEEVPLEEARREFEVNLFGLARLTQLLLPRMRERSQGTIVNVSSIGGRVHTPLGAWYHASKHALEGWSDSLRLELAPFGVRVVLIELGAIDTEFTDLAMETLEKNSSRGPYADLAARMTRAARRPYDTGRATPPLEIARLIAAAAESVRPRTRYVAGHLARPVLWARRLLGDRGYDWMVEKFL